MRAVVLALLLLMQQGGWAWGHASLVEASPADGVTLAAAPGEVRLRFDEAVGLIALTLVGPGGRVALAGVGVAGAGDAGQVVGAQVPAGLGRGTYLLSWRVTSADSHPVAGTLVFGVGAAPVREGAGREGAGVAEAGVGGAGERWLWPSIVLRWAFLVSLLAAAGGGLFGLVAPVPAGVRGWLAGVAGLGVILAAVQVGVRGALLLDWPGVAGAAPWLVGAGTTLAASLAMSALGLAGCGWAMWRAWRWAGAGGAVVALAGLALSGHAATAEPRWATGPALAVHGVAAAFWVGALWPLSAALRGGDGLLALRRFSAVALPAVGGLLISGAVLGVVQVGGWAMVWGSTYGLVLGAKLLLVTGLLGLAAWNRVWLTPSIVAGGAVGRLRSSIAAEMALAGCVVAVTAVLGLTPPARSMAVARDVSVWTQVGGVGALFEVAPGRAGVNEVAVTLERGSAREVWLELRHAAGGVSGVRRAMTYEGGRWVHRGREIALPGRWTLRAEVLVSEFELRNFTVEVVIP